MYHGVPLGKGTSVQDAYMFYKNVSFFAQNTFARGLQYYVHKESMVL